VSRSHDFFRTSPENVLAIYLLTGGALASGASAGIVHGSLNQTLALDGEDLTVSFDVGSASGNITFSFETGDDDFGDLTVTPGGDLAAQSGGIFAAPSTAGSSIDDSLGYASNKSLDMVVYDQEGEVNNNTNNWPLDEDAYLGFRLSQGDNDYNYGWIRLTVPSTSAGTLTLHDWAYEDQVNTAITAQAMNAVPGPAALAAFAAGACGLRGRRKRHAVA